MRSVSAASDANAFKAETPVLHRRLIIVDSPLAMRMSRVDAARNTDHGAEILTIPLLAARLAGGFYRPADHVWLTEAVSASLQTGALGDLEPIRQLPGTTRAVVASLSKVWREGTDLSGLAGTSPRAASLHELERRVLALLPSFVLAPPDLAARAIVNVNLVSRLFEAISLQRLLQVDPVWQPLVNAISDRVPTTWLAVGSCDRSWFAGDISEPEISGGGIMSAEICADPRSEVVEALRWARELLATNKAMASDIAFVAAAPAPWDDHMQVLSGSHLRVHFSHGRPALGTAVGQSCAALADILVHGLSQPRIRRLARLSPHLRSRLPRGWISGLKSDAGLFTAGHWDLALEAAGTGNLTAVSDVLLPVLALLEKGLAVAVEAGELLLSGKSLALWQDALRNAPAPAVMMALKSLRIADELEPGNSIVWGPASHFVGAPRKHMRLLGVAARSWPRADTEDPIFPARLWGAASNVLSQTEVDQQHFEILISSADEGAVLSRSQRSSEGALVAPSPLWRAGASVEQVRPRARIPDHAFSEADRLLARPDDARQSVLVASASQCWVDWNSRQVTAHDGLWRADHPAIARALSRKQSATSLRRLLRDPLGFVWKYGLDLRAPRWAQRPLELEPAVFGELVHALIKTTIDLLEPSPGLTDATRDQIRNAIGEAARLVQVEWPLSRAVPPALLWRYTLEDAARQAGRALTRSVAPDEVLGSGSRSWGELSFGDQTPPDGPWPSDASVTIEIGSWILCLEGRIDRLDIAADGQSVRLSDYKTGAVPKVGHGVVFDEGKEIQRTLYAMATRQLLGGDVNISSRLVYLDPKITTLTLEGDKLSDAEVSLVAYFAQAISVIQRGDPPPGPGAAERFNDLRLLLPADLERYLWRKSEAFEGSRSGLVSLWSRK